ncbi:MAG: glutamate-ammonia-ligase adenylyltransferase [Paraglaciecola sp.]|jgi:glutamate-ammonia-ligase adenylyltransferase
MSITPHLSPELFDLAAKRWQQLTESPSFSPDYLLHQPAIEQAFALSDFIADHCLRDPHYLRVLIQQQLLFSQQLDYPILMENALKDISSEAQLHQSLRQFRNLHMLRIAWRDLLNMQSIESSLQHVSDLANQLIVQAYKWLYANLSEKYGTAQGEDGPQPMFIIGMGKLGGGELNFSSDIDLIFTYPSQGETQGTKKPIEHQQFFTKLAQKLIAALHQMTVDGQVYRVDMRLRPFGESGPLVMHFAAMEDYYQEQGREWERYAMLKGRVINPQPGYLSELQAILKPFVYRRYLDYGAIDSLRTMKSLIQQEVRRRGLKNNIKLGEGGIREAEFIVQSLQLIRGGREPRLQSQSLLHNLHELGEMGVLDERDAQQLKISYLWLRKVEHCLQQFADQQTQVLPDKRVDQLRLVHVLACQNYEDFCSQLKHHCRLIHDEFLLLIGDETAATEQEAEPELEAFNDVWQLELAEGESSQILAPWLTTQQSAAYMTALRDFRQGLNHSRVGQRGLDTLNKLMPILLFSIVDNEDGDPVTLLERVLRVLRAIAGRTAYIELLFENQGALKQLTKLCTASPWVTEQISRFPMLLDELLNPAQLYNPTPVHEYSAELQLAMLRVDPDDLEQQMEALRQFKLSEQLKIAAADITGALVIMKVSDHLTYLAEALINQVLNMAWQQMSDKYGCPVSAVGDAKNEQNMGFAVIGFGKLGGLELGYGSDLDLVFVHNCEGNLSTNGPKAIESQHFYLKLARRILHLFNAKTASGQLYELDMRLRPSGNAGLMVSHIKGFADYQLHDAWTWEHQALIRARFICGSTELRQVFQQLRRRVLELPRDKATLATDVQKMREKMRQHLAKGTAQQVDLKQDKGGIADIEFIVQYYVLAHSHLHPNLTKWPDNVRILQTLADEQLLPANQAQQLTQAYLEYRNTNHRLTLQHQAYALNSDKLKERRQQVSDIWQHCFNSAS